VTSPGWNDHRVDDFAERTEENFREVRSELRDLRAEIRGIEKCLRGETDRHFAKLEGRTDRRSDITLGAMLTGFIGLIVTHFIG
jgi:hypothetical protein